ncbi:hypothetical protein [Micromonospora inyonensis]|uniref:Uncharacterized protein n=1 Tax=Micromonospora inyonensis TaxID=47866 RepID=A0A1C6SP64_9ACTN|nr:hypothetical protein [Micromonospora inyonensis]SCL31331.1 hypothetical protein GA0074694_5954 [Micromonospora inyonensis]
MEALPWICDSDPYPDALYATGGQNPQLKHAYLFTPAGWTLVTGTASVTGEGSTFNLSHTCAGQPSATPTPTPTPTLQAVATTGPTAAVGLRQAGPDGRAARPTN